MFKYQVKSMQKKQQKNAIKLAAIGAGIAGLAASAYFLFGPKGKKNQKHLKAWAIKMKADVIEKLEKAQEVTEPIYHKIIETVANEYLKKMKAGKEEIEELSNDLKKHWKTIGKTVKTTKKKVTSAKKK